MSTAANSVNILSFQHFSSFPLSQQNVNETNNSLTYFTFISEISSLCESNHNDLNH